MSDKRVFDGSFESLNDLFSLHPQGVKFLCPVCQTELIVALSWEEGANKGVHPGVYCPKNEKHVFRMMEFRR
jgi:hypothetical protein